MKIAIMQPYLFPYIGYFQLMGAVDKFVIFDDVNYIVRGWINRNRLLLNGKSYLFTAPLEKASPNKRIKDISISNAKDWRKDLLKTLYSCYCNAPHYKSAMEVIQPIIENRESNLSKFLYFGLLSLARYLQIETAIVESSECYKTEGLVGSEKIIQICKAEQSSSYVNPIGGMDLYRKEDFAAHGIELSFLRVGDITYSQFNHPFVPSLSIIDVLMLNSQEQAKELLSKYELVTN